MKKQPKLTPWFPAATNPVRPGVYIAEWPDYVDIVPHPWFAFWDGKQWGWMETNIELAVSAYKRGDTHAAGKLAWRGLAGRPKAVKL